MIRTGFKFVLLLVALVVSLPGCIVSPHGSRGSVQVVSPAPPMIQPGPPPHAKAYGQRMKHHYYYFPESEIYFDMGRSVYFHLENNRWVVSAKLPASLQVNLGSKVTLEMDVDRPYIYFDEHREKYPGKKEKHKNKEKKNNKRKHGGNDDEKDD